MSAQIIDGIAIANGIKEQVLDGVQIRLVKKLIPPGLAVIIIGDNPASEVYVAHKKKACEAVGIISKTIKIITNPAEGIPAAPTDAKNAVITIISC